MNKLNGIHNRAKRHKVRVKSRYCPFFEEVLYLYKLFSYVLSLSVEILEKMLDGAGGVI